ncbi:MAG: DUF3667 domain-containing protein [Saprospiraceae bacterium]|nr:DUF3667 domain-containing protein [Saprospiraceae bacterium]
MEDSIICKNCSNNLLKEQIYYPVCGQKTDAHVLSVKELVSNFWSSVFNFDNTLFKTIKQIWAPWKLTKFYVEGKRKSFLNPMRLFIFMLLFHFGFLVSLTHIDNIQTRSFNEYTELERSKLYEKFLLFNEKSTPNGPVKAYSDSIQSKLFTKIRTPDKDTFYLGNLNLTKYPITRKDAIEIPTDSIYSKYNITSFFDKIIVKQMIRMSLDRAGTLKYAIGNAAWGLVVAVILMGLLFKLLYIRKRRPYVEHLVFWMNVHSFCFLLVTLIVFFTMNVISSDDPGGILAAGLGITLPIVLYISMLKYYKQGKLKTFVKFFITSGFYLMVGVFVVLIVSLISLVFF